MHAHLSLDPVRREQRDRSAVPNVARTLNSAALFRLHGLIDSGPAVEVEPGKVQLSQVAGIVHVAHEQVRILGGAQAIDAGLVRDVCLLLQVGPAKREDTPQNVADVDQEQDQDDQEQVNHLE